MNLPLDVPEYQVFIWNDAKYIKADGILTEVVAHRGNVYRVKLIGADTITYLVNDGDRIWAHGTTLQEAKNDLLYKISNRDTSIYESFTLDTKVTIEAAVECYRAITGACVLGIKAFIDTANLTVEALSIRELIDMTRNQFGHLNFKSFFKE
jgi:hypothetical protein